LECLTKYWGFYFVAVIDGNGVGISDLQGALNGVRKYQEWWSDLSFQTLEERVHQSEVNSRIASKLFKKVLAARILVFELFLDIAIQVDGSLQEKHKRAWLLFQLSDDLDPELSPGHPFTLIIDNCLKHASDEALDELIGRLNTILKRLPRAKFMIVLDEAQWAVRSLPRSFLSSTDDTVFRSILREMVKVFAVPSVNLVVSGTGLSLGDLHDATASGVSKPLESVAVEFNLGMFETWEKLKKFLERYIPASFLETASGYCLQRRIREYLLGR
jgi:hypothetical protein